ncbi:hypothetical protein [Actinomyces sp. oral taxon 448]|uniref:hypothetical protein n=1 Tax=Actinomyces sp. oral taxon 448 TaxID=712124 RepID=UPI0002189818|nr:hypothetical protein [Actinomyces sp. oral taxon 448]EGQ73485.1 hypothetical protein HMPREF9062_2036 [Actinomyces sp. oral taxon 448 str. F0400]
MPDPQPLPALGDVVDVGSWARFSPSLAIFLDEQVRSRGLPGGPGDGLTVLLTAPAPVAVKEEPAAGGLRSLWRGRPRRALSPEVPGVALTGGETAWSWTCPYSTTPGESCWTPTPAPD